MVSPRVTRFLYRTRCLCMYVEGGSRVFHLLARNSPCLAYCGPFEMWHVVAFFVRYILVIIYL